MRFRCPSRLAPDACVLHCGFISTIFPPPLAPGFCPPPLFLCTNSIGCFLPRPFPSSGPVLFVFPTPPEPFSCNSLRMVFFPKSLYFPLQVILFFQVPSGEPSDKKFFPLLVHTGIVLIFKARPHSPPPFSLVVVFLLLPRGRNWRVGIFFSMKPQ